MLSLIALLAGLFTGSFTFWLLNPAPSGERYLRYAGVQRSTGASLRARTPSNTWIPELAKHLEQYLPSNYLLSVRNQIRMAGLNAPAIGPVYVVLQAALMTLGVMLGFTVGGPMGTFLILALGVAGALVPAAWLSQRVRLRQAAIDAALPDSVDMLTACTEAGLGLDTAIAQLIRRRSKAYTALNEELGRYMHELQMGISRHEALRNLGQRSGVEDLRTVINALIQGDALGVGVSQILRAQAQFLRLRRKQRAEEQAMKAPIKILFPLLFGIFPSIFVLLLGPAFLRVWDTLLAV